MKLVWIVFLFVTVCHATRMDELESETVLNDVGNKTDIATEETNEKYTDTTKKNITRYTKHYQRKLRVKNRVISRIQIRNNVANSSNTSVVPTNKHEIRNNDANSSNSTVMPSNKHKYTTPKHITPKAHAVHHTPTRRYGDRHNYSRKSYSNAKKRLRSRNKNITSVNATQINNENNKTNIIITGDGPVNNNTTTGIDNSNNSVLVITKDKSGSIESGQIEPKTNRNIVKSNDSVFPITTNKPNITVSDGIEAITNRSVEKSNKSVITTKTDKSNRNIVVRRRHPIIKTKKEAKTSRKEVAEELKTNTTTEATVDHDITISAKAENLLRNILASRRKRQRRINVIEEDRVVLSSPGFQYNGRDSSMGPYTAYRNVHT